MLSGKKIVVVSENEEPQKKKRKTLNLDPKRAEQMEQMIKDMNELHELYKNGYDHMYGCMMKDTNGDVLYNSNFNQIDPIKTDTMISEKAHKIGALMTETLQGLPRVEFMALCKEISKYGNKITFDYNYSVENLPSVEEFTGPPPLHDSINKLRMGYTIRIPNANDLMLAPVAPVPVQPPAPTPTAEELMRATQAIGKTYPAGENTVKIVGFGVDDVDGLYYTCEFQNNPKWKETFSAAIMRKDYDASL